MPYTALKLYFLTRKIVMQWFENGCQTHAHTQHWRYVDFDRLNPFEIPLQINVLSKCSPETIKELRNIQQTLSNLGFLA